MSCGSCNGCGHSPCSCDEACDPNNEPLASALNNFIASFFGAVGKTCVDGQVQWILPCDLNNGLPGFERRQGEGVACYLLRLFEYLQSLSAGISVSDEGVVISNPATSLNFTGGGVTATAAGGDVTVNIPCNSFYNKISINGECYDTWQAAYDDNAGAATPTLMLVGQGSSFGDLNLTAPYNGNIVIMGVGRSVSNLGNITGNGNVVSLAAFNIQMGVVTSHGAAITLSGLNTIFGSISSLNASGSGGSVTINNYLETGNITSTGTTSGGSVSVLANAIVGNINSSGVSGNGGSILLGREVSAGTLLASGAAGGAITLGDECSTGIITSKPLVAAGTGGAILISDDSVFGAIDNSGTVAGTFGGTVTIGDRCEGSTVSSLGDSGGGNVLIGEGFQGTSINSSSTTSNNAGSVTVSHRLTLSGNITFTGINNGGALVLGQQANIGGSILGSATNGTSGPITISDVMRCTTMTVNGPTSVGNISIGKFSVCGNIAAISASGTRGTFIIQDGTTISGAITATSSGNGGDITIGNSVTITGNSNFDANTGNAGNLTIGRGCNLANVRSGSGSGNCGTILVGQATTMGQVYGGTGGGAGRTAATIVIGEGAHVADVYAQSANAGGNSGSVTLEPGATATFIQVSSNSGTGGSVTLKNSNIITGLGVLSIEMGSVNTGTLISLNSRIREQIDNVNGTSWFRDLVGSTPAGNRDFIANLTASGAQFTNCLIVPNGTGVSIQASVPRTIIAYFLLQKNPFPANVTLSEGTETTSPNLLAP